MFRNNFHVCLKSSLRSRFHERLPFKLHCKTIQISTIYFEPVFKPNCLSKRLNSFSSHYNPRVFIHLSSSALKRHSLSLKDDQVKMFLFEELSNKLKSQSVCSVDDWKYMHDVAQENWTDSAFGVQVLSFCIQNKCFSMGKSFMDYLENCKINPSLVVLARYIRLCGECHNDIQEDYVLNLVHKIKQMTSVFDSKTASDVIVGLAITSQWRDCITLMKQIRLISSPTSSMYSSIIKAAFKDSEYSLAWQLIRKFLRQSQSIEAFNCVNWIDALEEERKKDKMRAEELMLMLLNFLAEYHFQVPHDCSEKIKKWFMSSENDWRAEYVSVPPDGKCCHCEENLKSNVLMKTEFDKLSDFFLNEVIIGEDAFQITNPKELDTFKTFVSETAPYDYVLDGLNVAYFEHSTALYTGQGNRADQLCTVVHNLVVKQKKKVLVVGKKHMLRWPRRYLSALKQMAYLFFIEHYSIDDVFVLYAAMYSGLGTKFVSKDLMRDHKHKLRNSLMSDLFTKWQLLHQIQMDKREGKVELLEPVLYNTALQITENTIHIPCSATENLEKSVSPPDKWLCIKAIKVNSDKKPM